MADGKSTGYSKIMIIPLTEGTGCDFCFARPPSEMVDPRALPCGHSHCTKCLEVNYQYREIECKTCRWVLNKTTYWPFLMKKGHYIGLVAKLYLLAAQLPKFACIYTYCDIILDPHIEILTYYLYRQHHNHT